MVSVPNVIIPVCTTMDRSKVDHCCSSWQVFDDCALSQPVKDELYKCYPDSKRAHLKTGGNFPYLCRSADVNLHIQVSILFYLFICLFPSLLLLLIFLPCPHSLHSFLPPSIPPSLSLPLSPLPLSHSPFLPPLPPPFPPLPFLSSLLPFFFPSTLPPSPSSFLPPSLLSSFPPFLLSSCYLTDIACFDVPYSDTPASVYGNSLQRYRPQVSHRRRHDGLWSPAVHKRIGDCLVFIIRRGKMNYYSSIHLQRYCDNIKDLLAVWSDCKSQSGWLVFVLELLQTVVRKCSVFRMSCCGKVQ